MFNNCNPEVWNNLMYSNVAYEEGGAIDLEGSCNGPFINNTIVDNFALFGGGLDVEVNSSPLFRNSIFWGNTAFVDGPQIHLFSEDSDPDFDYCDIEGGIDSIGTWYGGAIYLNYEGSYTNNIDIDPDFTTLDIYLYLLDDGSPCIDEGNPDPIYNDIEDPSFPGLAAWPSKGTIRNDMGSWGGPFVWFYDISTGIEESVSFHHHNSSLEQLRCYPNPVGGMMNIEYRLKNEGAVCLQVFDSFGREIETIVDCIQPQGEHILTIKTGHLSEGIYFVRARAGSDVLLRKIVVKK
jgi:hypothetical protein